MIITRYYTKNNRVFRVDKAYMDEIIQPILKIETIRQYMIDKDRTTVTSAGLTAYIKTLGYPIKGVEVTQLLLEPLCRKNVLRVIKKNGNIRTYSFVPCCYDGRLNTMIRIVQN